MQTRAAPRATGSLPHGERLRAAGFIVTIYGDVVEPRGGLALDGHPDRGLRPRRHQRDPRPHRRLAPGRRRAPRRHPRGPPQLLPPDPVRAATEFADAAARIFSPPPPPAPGSSPCSPPPRPRPPSCCAASRASAPACSSAPTTASAPARGIVLRADWLDGRAELRRLAAERWRLPELAAAYGGFTDRFAPLAADLGRGRPLDAESSLLARLLLVHGFRARRPRRPAPARRGAARRLARSRGARRLFADLYLRLSAAANSHVAATLHQPRGRAARRDRRHAAPDPRAEGHVAAPNPLPPQGGMLETLRSCRVFAFTQ